MCYLILKCFFVVIFAVIFPFLGWYVSAAYLISTFNSLWLTPFMLIICLMGSHLGLGAVLGKNSSEIRYVYEFAFVFLIMIGMFLIIVFNKVLKNIINVAIY